MKNDVEDIEQKNKLKKLCSGPLGPDYSENQKVNSSILSPLN